jgi:hypothetical protein
VAATAGSSGSVAATAGSSGSVAATTGSSGSVAATTGSSGSVSSGTTVAPPTVCLGAATAVNSTTLPYAVDSDFFAAGYEGDTGSISQTGDATGTICGGFSPAAPRAGAAANCWKVTYTLPDAGSAGFAAVEWQTDLQSMDMGAYSNNFGVAPGKIPPAGATEASFWAKGALGGETATFSVGSGGTGPCLDAVVSVAVPVTLTKTWTKYSVPFPAGASYAAGQVVGFTWDMGGLTASQTIYIDNIEWDSGSAGDGGTTDGSTTD